MNKQLELFPADDYSDKRPLPLIIASTWNFPLQYQATNGKTYFSVQDWIAGISKTDNPARFWSDLKTRLKKSNNEIYARCVQLKYQATDGKFYAMDFADDETLYQITQRMNANTGLRDKVLAYLAKSGAFVDKARRDGTLESIARLQSKEKRKDFTAIIKNKSLRFDAKVIGLATNTIYSRLFSVGTEYTAKREIVAILGLTDKQAKNMRDHINTLALKAIEMAEEAATIKIDNSPNALTDAEILYIVKQCARIVAIPARELADFAGVDLLTGRSHLIGKGR